LIQQNEVRLAPHCKRIRDCPGTQHCGLKLGYWQSRIVVSRRDRTKHRQDFTHVRKGGNNVTTNGAGARNIKVIVAQFTDGKIVESIEEWRERAREVILLKGEFVDSGDICNGRWDRTGKVIVLDSPVSGERERVRSGKKKSRRSGDEAHEASGRTICLGGSGSLLLQESFHKSNFHRVCCIGIKEGKGGGRRKGGRSTKRTEH